jgi:flagellar basal-body rod protein FlgF
MSDSMNVTASDLGALSKQYQAITHNLANANTVGYKRQVSNFRRILNSQAGDGDPTPGSQHIGHPVRNDVQMDFTQGVLEATGRSLDVAINGEGAFFVVETAQGPLYSRNGSFHLSPEGKLVDATGRQIAGQNGQITVPSDVSVTDIQIARDGNCSADGTSFGKIKLVQIEDLTQLKPAGSGCYRLPASTRPKDASEAQLQQGHLEKSNVDAVEELVKLIQVTRLYEAGVKSITSQDERLGHLLRVAQG